jgi:hypothetical protein
MLRNKFFLPSVIKCCVLCNACYELLYYIMSIIKEAEFFFVISRKLDSYANQGAIASDLCNLPISTVKAKRPVNCT